ncbi:hypothetical protein [Haliangium sp.]|uniref:hypothetical protein n=1 Tax=Haliangium sp. TaxID=2663208 RepID=UPI003D1459FB
MSDIDHRINSRIEAFIDEINQLAQRAARDALSTALDRTESRTTRKRPKRAAKASTRSGPARGGGKRSAQELDNLAEFFFVYVTQKPGQRMEQITEALGYSSAELALPVKKLVEGGKLRVEGQKRASRYYPAKGAARRRRSR